MHSLVAEPAANIAPAPPAPAVTPPEPAAPGDEPVAPVTASPNRPSIRPSIGPPAPPRSELEQMLARCDRLRLR